MNDPYAILGVSPQADLQEIRRAYLELVKQYHPDSYIGNPLSHLAEEKLKQINRAYEQIQKQRQQGAPHGARDADPGKSLLARARASIASGAYSNADLLLDSASNALRNAEWHYLKGIVLIHRGWYLDAHKHLSLACQMDPYNAEYQEALNRLNQRAGGIGGNTRGAGGCSSCSTCDICTGLLCADCLCECCGGDLIPCC